MDLSGIKTVEISNDAIGRVSKFIVAQVSDAKTSKTILRSSAADYHNEIAQALIGQLKGLDVKIKGGGRLYLDSSAKRIWLWGRSSSFGAPDYEQVQSLLKSNYRDYELILKEYQIGKQPL